jgi:hypothetical protein
LLAPHWIIRHGDARRERTFLSLVQVTRKSQEEDVHVTRKQIDFGDPFAQIAARSANRTELESCFAAAALIGVTTKDGRINIWELDRAMKVQAWSPERRIQTKTRMRKAGALRSYNEV